MKQFFKTLSLAFVILTISTFAWAQGNLSKANLDKITSSLTLDEDTRALMNAISSNDIKKLAISRENIGKLNPYFSNRLTSKESQTKTHQAVAGCIQV